MFSRPRPDDLKPLHIAGIANGEEIQALMGYVSFVDIAPAADGHLFVRSATLFQATRQTSIAIALPAHRIVLYHPRDGPMVVALHDTSPTTK